VRPKPISNRSRSKWLYDSVFVSYAKRIERFERHYLLVFALSPWYVVDLLYYLINKYISIHWKKYNEAENIWRLGLLKKKIFSESHHLRNTPTLSIFVDNRIT